jgi:hypothetical protein
MSQTEQGRQATALLEHGGNSALAQRQSEPTNRSLDLGDLKDQQRAAWRKSLDVLDENTASIDPYYLFPDDREIPGEVATGLRVKLSAMELRRPQSFGNCWLGCELWDTLELGRFWKERLPKHDLQQQLLHLLQLMALNFSSLPQKQLHIDLLPSLQPC